LFKNLFKPISMGCLNSKNTDDSDYDFLFKLVLVGEVGVGKSSLVLRYTDEAFIEEDVGTIGADFKVKFLTTQRKKLKLQIWDTAGQEKFRIMTSSYFGGASAILVVFDLTNRSSFEELEKWIKEAATYISTTESPKYIVIGNKLDICKQDKNSRKITTEEAEEFAKKWAGSLYFETSAKDGANVNTTFNTIGEGLLDAKMDPLS